MSRYALLLSVLPVLALAGCGNGDGDELDAGADATSADSQIIIETCNPITQGGCDPPRKCSLSWESIDPPAGDIDCLSAGTRGRWETCVIDLVEGRDDCSRGFLCWEVAEGDYRCAELCETADGDSCSSGTCMEQPGVLAFDFQGVCFE